ncbi:MAG: metallophosphoesterase [Myxococcota bacterium]
MIEGLRLGEGFGFHMVTCASLAQVEHARARLAAALGDRAVLVDVEVTDLGQPRALIERLIEQTPPGVLVLSATVMATQSDRWSLVFQRLNEARNHVIRCFDGLVLVLSSSLKSVFSHNAQDFFSLRSSSVVLGEPRSDEEADEEAVDVVLEDALEDDDEDLSTKSIVRGGLRDLEVDSVKSVVSVDERPRGAPSPSRSSPLVAPEPKPQPKLARRPSPALPPSTFSKAPDRPPAAPAGAPPARSRSPRFGAVIERLRRLTRRRGRGLDPRQPPIRVLLLSSLLVPGQPRELAPLEERMRWLMEDLHRLWPRSDRPRFDLLLVAGDVASWGRTSEMKHASKLLHMLMAHLSTPQGRPSLLLVPGNHDMSKGLAKWRSLVDRGEDLDGMMKQRNNMAIAREGGLGFRTMVQRLHEEGLVPLAPAFDPYALVTHELLHGRRRVAIRGFDSAWGLPWVGHQRGVLGSGQLEAALAGLDHADCRIAVVHHPPDMMDPGEWALLRETFDLVLTGPSTSASPVQRSAGRAVLVTGPGLSGKSMTASPAGYAVLELGGAARVQLRWVDPRSEPLRLELPLGPSRGA